MSDRTNYLEDAWLNQIARGIDFTFPPELYVALIFAVTSSEAGTFDEVTGASYVRQTASFGAPVNGVISSSANITFPQATGEYPAPVTHFALMDSGSDGNALYVAPVGTGAPKIFSVTDADLFTAPSHSLVDGNETEVKGATGLSLPVGLLEDTSYFIVSQSGDDFRVALTLGGVPVDVGAGVGWIRRLVPRTILTDDTAQFLSGSLQIIAS